MTIQDDIDAIESFLISDLDVHVIFGSEEPNAYWEDVSGICISVNTNQSKKLQLYSILHEAGHAIVRRRDRYDVLYPYGRAPKKNICISKRVDTLREEIAAWEEGEILANKFGMELNMSQWHKFMKKNIFEYIKWAYDPNNYNIIKNK